ncbi:TetR/AcrR family transcriptional regulator [Amycolatopsis sp. WGS_07]|uniref:TetR/AcrR family transcriptional regulator n=1 Tax=Amycolatopsis sp. WGS_07 TaxID=3076764 RepID=UPI0038731332
MDRTASRPRKADAIYSATLALLAERGYDALTVEAVAAQAGVHKTTIYRTWATKDEVLADALVQAPELTFAIPDTGTLRGDLLELAKQIHRLLSDPANRRIITAVVSALPDRPATAEAAGRFFADRLGREQAVFDRAHDRGELADAADSELVMDLLGGNLWFHTLIRAKSADDAYLERLVDTVLTGVAR